MGRIHTAKVYLGNTPKPPANLSRTDTVAAYLGRTRSGDGGLGLAGRGEAWPESRAALRTGGTMVR